MLTNRDFEVVYRCCKNRLLGIARRSVPCDADAEDVLHSAFARFFEKAPRHMDPDQAQGYLLRCVTNAAADWWRVNARQREHRQDTAEPDAGRDDPVERAMADEERGAVREAVASLPGRQQQAVMLRYYGAVTVGEAAATMGCAPATVRSLLRHALQRLGELLMQGGIGAHAGEEKAHD